MNKNGETLEVYELRILENYIENMPKVYRKRNINWVVVQDILMAGTSTAGRTSCCEKCEELGIDPWGYKIEEEIKADGLDKS